MALIEREMGRKLLKQYEEAGITQKSRSSYCSPAFVKWKKAKSKGDKCEDNAEEMKVEDFRLLTDYKELNKHIASDSNSPPRIETIIQTLKS